MKDEGSSPLQQQQQVRGSSSVHLSARVRWRRRRLWCGQGFLAAAAADLLCSCTRAAGGGGGCDGHCQIQRMWQRSRLPHIREGQGPSRWCPTL